MSWKGLKNKWGLYFVYLSTYIILLNVNHGGFCLVEYSSNLLASTNNPYSLCAQYYKLLISHLQHKLLKSRSQNMYYGQLHIVEMHFKGFRKCNIVTQVSNLLRTCVAVNETTGMPRAEFHVIYKQYFHCKMLENPKVWILGPLRNSSRCAKFTKFPTNPICLVNWYSNRHPNSLSVNYYHRITFRMHAD